MSNATQYPFFVYGTLRPGQGNYHRLTRHDATIYREDVATLPGYTVANVEGAHFPGILPGEGRVVGNLIQYNITAVPTYNALLRDIDRLEGYSGKPHPSNLYNRELLEVEQDGKKVKAWVYVWNAGPEFLETPIPSGDWLKQ